MKSFVSILLFLFVCSAVAYLPGESSYPSLSFDKGAFGNPASAEAFGSSGAFLDVGVEKGERLFRLGGNFGNFAAGFHYLTDNETIDETYWNLSHGFSLFENTLFLGNRVSAFRSRDFKGTEWLYSPGVIFRPFSFLSLGYTSKNLGYLGEINPGRVQEWGATLRYKNFSLSLGAENLDVFRLLYTMDFWGFLAGLEMPLVGGGPYRLTLSHSLGSNFNTSLQFSSSDYLPHRFRFAYHSAKDLSASNVGIIRVPLNSEIKEMSNQGIPFLFPPSLDIHVVRNHIEHLLMIPGKTIVILDFSGYAGGFAISKEIQRGVQKLQQAGKFVIAFLDDVRPSTWVAAASANYIVAEPSARVSFKGFGGSSLYYKGLLDKLGVKVEFLRHGKYKSAVETYMADSMSQEAKENLKTLYTQRWDLFKKEKPALEKEMEAFAESPQITANAAYEKGLIDSVLYLENVPEFAVKKIFGIEAPFASALTMSPKEKTILEDNWGHRPRFALLTIEGTITEKSVRHIQKELRQVYGGTYRGLILRINSPGGSAKASDELYATLRDLSKRGVPVVASIGDYGASGGFYIACGADKIIAENFSLVGSIGIYGGKIDASNLLSKLGVKTETVKTHEHADAETFTRPFDKAEQEALQNFMDDFYNRFLNVVSKATAKSKEEIDKNFGEGRVFLGKEAKENGLIYELGGLDKAIEIAKELSGVSQKSTVELVSILNEKAFVTKSPKIYLAEILAEYDLFKVWALDLNILDMSIEK